MNKKGIAPVVAAGVGAPVIIIIIFALIFLVSVIGGFKIVSVLKDIPIYVWYGIAALILYKIFIGGKK